MIISLICCDKWHFHCFDDEMFDGQYLIRMSIHLHSLWSFLHQLCRCLSIFVEQLKNLTNENETVESTIDQNYIKIHQMLENTIYFYRFVSVPVHSNESIVAAFVHWSMIHLYAYCQIRLHFHLHHIEKQKSKRLQNNL